MKVRFLGAHNLESDKTRLPSVLVDNILLLDAGGLTGSLSFEEQARIKYIVLSHHHYDHIRDIPCLCLAFFGVRTFSVYGAEKTLSVLSSYLVDGTLYPKFTERPENNPTLKLIPIEPLNPQKVGEYTITLFPANHTVESYAIFVERDRKLFYTGDTGPGIRKWWERVNPDLIIFDLTLPDRFEEMARETGHLSPKLLYDEIKAFRDIKGYTPKIALTHISPLLREEIEREVSKLEEGLSIIIGREGLEIEV